MKRIFTLAALLLLSSYSFADTKACKTFARTLRKGTAAAKLKNLLAAEWSYIMTEFPEMATNTGYPGQNDRWTDESLEANERRKLETRCLLKDLNKIPRKALGDKDKVTYDLAVRDQKMSIESDPFGGEFMPVNHMSGVQNDSADTITSMPTATRKDFEDIASRLEKLPILLDQNEALMREGLKRQLTASRFFLPKVLDQIDKLLSAKVEDSTYYKPFLDMGKDVAPSEQETLRERARLAINDKINPALRHFREFIAKEYIPQARTTLAYSDLPNGRAFYAYLVKYHTTTNSTPEELHNTGLSEVVRIESEMSKIKDQVQFKGDLKAFNKFLMTDERFYYTTADALLIGYRDITKRIDPELPRLFKTLPRLTYGVCEIPTYRAPSDATADYQNGTLEAGRAGYFEANTYDLKSRPKWEMETLALHEGVPGHHFQISRSQEMQDLPEFRRFGGNTAYVEGWALYAESLGQELGFFKDPYSLYGHYADELLRAVRLVVDTGMHAKGWSRDKALAYYREKLPASDIDSENEINRYAVWPGQALAYKVGQMKIRALREKASAALGDKFDVREFHDVVLDEGSVPMDVLESLVDKWIAAKKKSSPRKSA